MSLNRFGPPGILATEPTGPRAILMAQTHMRHYVQQRVGAEVLTTLHVVTSAPHTNSFAELPNRFVVTSTHGSGWVRVVTENTLLDTRELIATCQNWLDTSYYEYTREWVYREIEPRILIEEFIDDGSGQAPTDYRFCVYSRKIALVQADQGRFSQHRRDLYDLSWNNLDVTCEVQNLVTPAPPRSPLGEMIQAAETLGAGLDFVRADSLRHGHTHRFR